MRQRIVATALALGLLLAACGNAGSSKNSSSDTTVPKVGADALNTDTSKFVKVDSKGVTDSEIRVAVITDATNILGGHYKELADGIQAYFDKVNDAGGIYKRKLVIAANRDDKQFQNQQEVKASLAQDNAFATFVATTLFSGANDLQAAGMPTFTWNINPEFAGKTNIFGTTGAICFTCTGQYLPWLAEQNHFTSIGVLAYGVADESKKCADGVKNSFEK